MPDGKWSYYFPNGSIQRMHNYKLGRMDGLSVTYDRRGRKLQETEYKMNRKHGKFVTYNDRTGEIEQHLIFENGKMVKTVKGLME